MASVLGFPNPVNEVAARLVAAAVAVTAWVVVGTGFLWLVVPLAYGFWARVLTGPTLSPLGRAAVALAPRLAAPRSVPGPPKRFAQGIGTACTTIALVAWVAGAPGVATAFVALIAVAATLEAVLAFCMGCWLFGLLMRVGVIPASVCEACNDLRLARPAVTAGS